MLQHQVWASRSSGIHGMTNPGALQASSLVGFVDLTVDLEKYVRPTSVSTATFPRRQLWLEEVLLYVSGSGSAALQE